MPAPIAAQITAPISEDIRIRLKTFLTDPARQEGALGYEALMGFLFLLACTPERVPPAEWSPTILPGEGDIPPQQQSPALRQGIQDVLACFKVIQQQVEDETPRLPDDCAPVADAANNFGPAGALGRWSGGVLIGLHWLSETWEYALDDETDEEFSAITMILTFFANRELAEEYRQEFEDTNISIEALAVDLLDAVPEALQALAELGHELDVPEEVLPGKPSGNTHASHKPSPRSQTSQPASTSKKKPSSGKSRR